MLALVCAEGVGARAETAVPGAVAVELIHTFSLVHDDIMDGDDRRRHRPSTWKAYGVGPAVMAGDALLALAVETLARAPSANASQAIRLLSSTLIELVDGQAQDLHFEARPWTGSDAVTVDEYQAMATRKTGALLACSAAIGPVLAGARVPVVEAIAQMGRHLGLAFQAVDDLLGIWGDPAVTGKPVYSDLRQRKKTIPVVAALATGTVAGRRLAALLAAGGADEEDLRRAAALVSEAGGRAITEDLARRHVTVALQIVRDVALASSAAEDLVALSGFVVERIH
jgi:geranylgeranyl diphosphate synthase type I